MDELKTCMILLAPNYPGLGDYHLQRIVGITEQYRQRFRQPLWLVDCDKGSAGGYILYTARFDPLLAVQRDYPWNVDVPSRMLSAFQHCFDLTTRQVSLG